MGVFTTVIKELVFILIYLVGRKHLRETGGIISKEKGNDAVRLVLPFFCSHII